VSGRDLVTWLLGHVDGLSSRRQAKTYVASLLKAGYIRHTVNKSSFSEKCYYIFTDIVKGQTVFHFYVILHYLAYLLVFSVVSWIRFSKVNE